MKKVLVLGGGFAGLETAIYLRKQGISVTLVSQRDYFYIYPTSIWIPTGETTLSDVSVPLDKLAMKHGFELIIEEVTSVDAKAKKVILSSGRVLEDYFYLVLALGQDKLTHKGIEHTLSICGKPEEAVELYKSLDALILKDNGKVAMGFGANPLDKSAVRGGPAYEVLFNVDNYLRKKGVRENFELTFFAPMEKPGAKMGEKAMKMMDKMFTSKNIHKKIGTKIVSFEKYGILFGDDTKLMSDLTMYISAGTGHSVLKAADLPLSEAGFVVTNAYNEVEEVEGVYAVGDSSALLGPEWKAKQGHVAEVMAKNVAYNIFQHQQNIDSKRSYVEHINILCVMDTGDGAAFVYRNHKKAHIIPLPIIGHWMKKLWGVYCRYSKLGKVPRLPGM